MREIATRATWPLLVTASIGAATAALIGGSPFGLTGLAVLVIAATAAIEPLLPADPNAALTRDPQRWNDFGHYVAGGFAGEALGQSIAALAAITWAERIPVISIWPGSWPAAAQIALLIAAADLLEYGRHRLLHRVPWLWRIHALHHSSDRLHALKSGRVHALDVMTRSIFVLLPLVWLGAPARWLPVYPAALLVFGPIAHANLDLWFPRWVHSIAVTPSFHSLHHARDRAFANSNFAAVLPVWDWLFGTFVDPEGRPRQTCGIEEPVPNGFLAQIAWPFRTRQLD
jgi:sterol desaturase/sphingolipid hydroxylase (fatty acid hydroxylase superfamily)